VKSVLLTIAEVEHFTSLAESIFFRLLAISELFLLACLLRVRQSVLKFVVFMPLEIKQGSRLTGNVVLIHQYFVFVGECITFDHAYTPYRGFEENRFTVDSQDSQRSAQISPCL
jgi:hypothetical protein